jgi:hypothetical protein
MKVISNLSRFGAAVGWRRFSALGVYLVIGIAISGAEARGGDLFLPVKLICPADNGGTLVLLTENDEKSFMRYKVTYDENGEPVRVVMGGDDGAGTPLRDSLSYDLLHPKDDSFEKTGQLFLSKANLKGPVCDASPATKKRYFARLAANWNSLNPSKTSFEKPATAPGDGEAQQGL